MSYYVPLIANLLGNGSGGNSVGDRRSCRRKCVDFLQFLMISVILSEVGLHLLITTLGQVVIFYTITGSERYDLLEVLSIPHLKAYF